VVTSRILTRRRHDSDRAEHPISRLRRTVPPVLVQMAADAAAVRRRLSARVRIYLVGVVVLVMAVLNLLLAGQATEVSYQLGQMRQDQSQLVAEKGQLSFEQASQRTPAEVAKEAQQQHMAQPSPDGYLVPQPLGFSLWAPIGVSPEAGSPWQFAIAILDRLRWATSAPREPA
jgi:cell division protein FtsL